jgi:ribose transport system substrate-binding protein
MDGVPHGVSCAIFAATCAFAAVFSSPAARAADPLMALILGVKASPFDEALACGALDAGKKLGLHIDLFAPDHCHRGIAGGRPVR